MAHILNFLLMYGKSSGKGRVKVHATFDGEPYDRKPGADENTRPYYRSKERYQTENREAAGDRIKVTIQER